jgi:hypothetical protein
MATYAQRLHLHALMRLLIAHEPEVHYAQVRPMRNVHTATPHFPMAMDCSEAVTCLCKWAGLTDPNGRHFDGTGNTQTLYSHLPHYYNPASAEVGALVTFAVPTSPLSRQHVCMVLEPDDHDPLLFSHGMERGPLAIRLSAERRFHASPVTFLSIARL